MDTNRGLTAPAEPLISKGDLQCDLHQHQKWSVEQKNLFQPLEKQTNYWSEICEFEVKGSLTSKIINEKSAILLKIFGIIPTFYAQFSIPGCPKIPILHTINILPKLLLVDYPWFCVISLPPINLFLTSLTNFLHLILSYKKTKNILITPPYLFWVKQQKLLRCANISNLLC